MKGFQQIARANMGFQSGAVPLVSILFYLRLCSLQTMIIFLVSAALSTISDQIMQMIAKDPKNEN